MRYLVVLFITLNVLSCATASKGKPYQRGQASWYGPGFQGKKTANGEAFDMNQLTAAHRSLPFGTFVTVRSLSTKRQVVVRINDRGPYAGGRIIDLSKGAARRLDMLERGETEVELFTGDR